MRGIPMDCTAPGRRRMAILLGLTAHTGNPVRLCADTNPANAAERAIKKSFMANVGD